MNDTERVIGKLEEFRERVLADLAAIRADLEKVEKEVSQLNQLKWQMSGIAAAGAFVLNWISNALIKG